MNENSIKFINDAFINHVQSMCYGKDYKWNRTWSHGTSIPLTVDGKYYSGINILTLWFRRKLKPTWIGRSKINELKGWIKIGSKASWVLVPLIKESKDTGEKELMGYRPRPVFNVEDITGLPEDYYKQGMIEFKNSDEVIEDAEIFFGNVLYDYAHLEKGSPSYRPDEDKIYMPSFAEFKDAENYYQVLSHELVHWTGHKSRLNRIETCNKSRKEYAYEELVAEIGSAYILSHLGIRDYVSDNSLAYVSSWLNALQNDKKFVIDACKDAYKALQFTIEQNKISDDIDFQQEYIAQNT